MLDPIRPSPIIPSFIQLPRSSVASPRPYNLDPLRGVGRALRYRLAGQPHWNTIAQTIPMRRTVQRKSPPRPQA